MVASTNARLLIKMEEAKICIVHLKKTWTIGVGSAELTVCVASMEKTTAGAELISLVGDTVGW